MSKNNELFRNALLKVASDPEVQNNPELLKLIKNAIAKAEKNQSVQSIGSNLAWQIRSHFNEFELPKSVVDLQLDLQRFTAIGGNGMVANLNKFTTYAEDTESKLHK